MRWVIMASKEPFTRKGGARRLHIMPGRSTVVNVLAQNTMPQDHAPYPAPLLAGVEFMPSFCRGGFRLPLSVSALPCLLMAGVCAWLFSSAAEPSQPQASEPAKATRIPWTTSRVVGSPDPPPPFKVVRAFPKLKFEHPLLLARAPGSDRLFVGEQAGVLYSFADKPDAKADLFFDLRKELKTIDQLKDAKEVEAIYGLTFHPDFEKNRQCFV